MKVHFPQPLKCNDCGKYLFDASTLARHKKFYCVNRPSVSNVQVVEAVEAVEADEKIEAVEASNEDTVIENVRFAFFLA